MWDKGFILTKGGDEFTRLKMNGKKFATITEVPTPVRDAHASADRLRELFSSIKRTAGTAYQPVMVADVDAHEPRRTADTRLNWIAQALSDICFPFEGLSLLDLGCSTGYMSLAFDAYGFTVTGVDANATSLELANCASDVVRGNVTFINEWCLNFLSHTSGSYDVVLLLNLLHWLHRQNKWGPPQVEEFIQSLADRTRIALALSFFPKRACMGEQGKTEDSIRRWGEGKFSAIKYLGAGKAYPLWLCIR